MMMADRKKVRHKAGPETSMQSQSLSDHDPENMVKMTRKLL